MAAWRTKAHTRGLVGRVDLASALRLCAEDPAGTVLAAARMEAALAEGATHGGPNLWGAERDGELVGFAWAGANLVTVTRPGDGEAVDRLADIARTQGRRCSSLVGPAETVMGIWKQLASEWGPARDVRADQPSLVIDTPALVAGDPEVKAGTLGDMPELMPACVAMFVEEVGYSPLEGFPGSYEARVRDLVRSGRSFMRSVPGPHGPRIGFKAELGAVSSQVAQVQGVWVPPDLRGQGLATAGMAAVVNATLGTVAPTVSLYVNHYNTAAIRVYEKVGFRQVGTYATVLF